MLLIFLHGYDPPFFQCSLHKAWAEVKSLQWKSSDFPADKGCGDVDFHLFNYFWVLHLPNF